MTRGPIVKRNVGFAVHVDERVRAYAERRGMALSAAINMLCVEGLDRLEHPEPYRLTPEETIQQRINEPGSTPWNWTDETERGEP